MQSVSYQELLRNNRHFRRLWCGQVVSELGTWFSFIAELGTVGMLSDSPLATMALLVSRLLPVLLFAPVAGVLVDRASRKQVMIAADLIRSLIALGFLGARIGAPVWFIVLCSGLMSATNTFFDAAKNASIANMVTRQEMLTANVLMFSTRYLQFAMGSALGGVTAAKFGYTAAFIINSISYLVSAAFIWRIPAAVLRRVGGGESSGEPEAAVYRPADHRFWDEVRQGLRYIWVTPFVRAVILLNIGWATGGGMNTLLFDRISRHEFAHGPGPLADWNLAGLTMASGAGLFIGMMLARRAGAWASEERRAGRFIGWAIMVHGFCFAIGGVTTSIVAMGLCIGFSRLVLGAEFGVQETLMMRVIPDHYRGRVFTTDRALELSTMTLSMLVAGSLLTWVNPRSLMIASGLLSASPGLMWLLAMWRARISVPAAAVRENYALTTD
ncbi:MAG TPA: MFS transporter [Blastocatellia bacterium]|nr:MFS transporter [Blastocatellia bacterium]